LAEQVFIAVGARRAGQLPDRHEGFRVAVEVVVDRLEPLAARVLEAAALVDAEHRLAEARSLLLLRPLDKPGRVVDADAVDVGRLLETLVSLGGRAPDEHHLEPGEVRPLARLRPPDELRDALRRQYEH